MDFDEKCPDIIDIPFPRVCQTGVGTELDFFSIVQDRRQLPLLGVKGWGFLPLPGLTSKNKLCKFKFASGQH